MSLPRRPRRRRRRACAPSRASGRFASPGRTTSNTSASSSRLRRAAPGAAGRGCMGPRLLATILFEKCGMHTPLNRQSARFKCEEIDLPLSTLADQVGHGTFAVMPLFHLIESHVLAAERLHGDDTTIRILAKSKCTTGRIWTYVRDDRPFAGPAPPAAVYKRPTRRAPPEASGPLRRYPESRLLQRLRAA